MTCLLHSKFFSNCTPKKLLNLHNKNVVTSVIEASYKNIQPVHMAYTAYEVVSSNVKSDVPILILHGLLGSKTNWNSMGRQIALKTYRKVLTLDARNHGDSPHTNEFSYYHLIEDLKHLMEELDIKEASLIGHSLGGRAMMAFALTNPNLVRDLVVVDISPFGMGESTNYLPIILKAMRSVKLSPDKKTIHKVKEEVDEQLKATVQNAQLRTFLLMNLAFDEEKNRYYWKVNIKSLIENLPAVINFPDFKSVFEKPTLFVAGDLSDFLKKEDEPKILEKFPNSKFVYVKDAGHLVHFQKPEEFLGLVSNFFSDRLEQHDYY